MRTTYSDALIEITVQMYRELATFDEAIAEVPCTGDQVVLSGIQQNLVTEVDRLFEWLLRTTLDQAPN